MDGWFDLFLYYRYLSATSVSDRDNITWAGQVNNLFFYISTKTFI